MVSVEQRELTEVGSFPTREELGKLTKDKLIKLIEDIELQVRKEERQKEWGQQFDIWLIRAARKERAVEFTLSVKVEGEFVIVGIPKRVDKYEIQIATVDGHNQEIWINKAFIVACKAHVAEDSV